MYKEICSLCKGNGFIIVVVKGKDETKQCWLCESEGEKKMRYEYTVTKEGGEAEIMKEMSWKKLFKKLLMKYPKFSGWCTYMNKKGHLQQRSFREGKETRK